MLTHKLRTPKNKSVSSNNKFYIFGLNIKKKNPFHLIIVLCYLFSIHLLKYFRVLKL